MLYDMTSLQAVNGSVSQACLPEYTLANGQPHSGMVFGGSHGSCQPAGSTTQHPRQERITMTNVGTHQRAMPMTQAAQRHPASAPGAMSMGQAYVPFAMHPGAHAAQMHSNMHAQSHGNLLGAFDLAATDGAGINLGMAATPNHGGQNRLRGDATPTPVAAGTSTDASPTRQHRWEPTGMCSKPAHEQSLAAKLIKCMAGCLHVEIKTRHKRGPKGSTHTCQRGSRSHTQSRAAQDRTFSIASSISVRQRRSIRVEGAP